MRSNFKLTRNTSITITRVNDYTSIEIVKDGAAIVDELSSDQLDDLVQALTLHRDSLKRQTKA